MGGDRGGCVKRLYAGAWQNSLKHLSGRDSERQEKKIVVRKIKRQEASAGFLGVD